MKSLSVAGIEVPLIPLDKSELSNVILDSILRFDFFRGYFNGQAICFMKPKNPSDHSPTMYRKTIERVCATLSIEVALLLDNVEFYFRKRLIEAGVFFVVSGKYAFLPSIIINSKMSKSPRSYKQLPPSAQLILLYYLLNIKEGTLLTIKEASEKLSLGYVTASLGFKCLEDFGLCAFSLSDNRTKQFQFSKPHKELWKQAEPYFVSPIKKVVFCDVLPDNSYLYGGITALSEYSNLNSDRVTTFAILDRDFEGIEKTNEIEGDNRIELWSYDPRKLSDRTFVDKLSLFLTLMNDTDSRVQNELEIIIEQLW